MNTTEEKQMKNPLGYKSEKGLPFSVCSSQYYSYAGRFSL